MLHSILLHVVTGASGFLGGRLTQILAERGERVRVLVRPGSDIRHLDGLSIEIARGDLTDLVSIRAALAGAQRIYHCAAASTDWAAWPIYYRANILGVQNMLHVARGLPALDRFVHISSSDVYGYPRLACDESHPRMDVGLPYNRSKVLGEMLVWEAAKAGLPVTVLRPVSIYGPRGKDFVLAIGELIQQKSMAVFNGGRSRAGLIYVDNAVDAILNAAVTPQALGQVYNLRDEGDQTWRQYVDTLADALHEPRPRLNLNSGLAWIAARLLEGGYSTLHLKGKPLLTRHSIALMSRDQGYPIEKIKRELGFVSKISFDEGIARSAAWLRAQTAAKHEVK